MAGLSRSDQQSDYFTAASRPSFQPADGDRLVYGCGGDAFTGRHPALPVNAGSGPVKLYQFVCSNPV